MTDLLGSLCSLFSTHQWIRPSPLGRGCPENLRAYTRSARISSSLQFLCRRAARTLIRFQTTKLWNYAQLHAQLPSLWLSSDNRPSMLLIVAPQLSKCEALPILVPQSCLKSRVQNAPSRLCGFFLIWSDLSPITTFEVAEIQSELALPLIIRSHPQCWSLQPLLRLPNLRTCRTASCPAAEPLVEFGQQTFNAVGCSSAVAEMWNSPSDLRTSVQIT